MLDRQFVEIDDKPITYISASSPTFKENATKFKLSKSSSFVVTPEGVFQGGSLLDSVIGRGADGMVFAFEKKEDKTHLYVKYPIGEFKIPEYKYFKQIYGGSCALFSGVNKSGEKMTRFVMPKIKGDTLIKILREQKVRPREFLELYVRFMDAFKEFHKKGLVHGDSHFNNVLFDDKNATVNIIDFAYTKKQGEFTEPRIGKIVAPELQSKKNKADPSQDVYTIGCMIEWYFNIMAEGNLNLTQDEKALCERMKLIRDEMCEVDVAKRITLNAAKTKFGALIGKETPLLIKSSIEDKSFSAEIKLDVSQLKIEDIGENIAPISNNKWSLIEYIKNKIIYSEPKPDPKGRKRCCFFQIPSASIESVELPSASEKNSSIISL